MSKWLNNKHIQMGVKNGEWNGFYKWLLKGNQPCHFCGYCPYGKLVEEFPLKERSKYSCKVFGHDCPAYYQAEPMAEVQHKGKWVGYVEGLSEKKKGV
jgi:hypothetical protein